MQNYSPASEIAKRRQTAEQETKELSGTQRFFDEMRQEEKIANTAANTRAQTAHMKKAMTFKNENFDKSMQYSRRLEAINADAKRQLLDEQIKFSEDSAGRRYMNERQLQDWYNTRAKSEQDWQEFQMKQEIYHKRRLTMLQQAYKVVDQAEKQAYQSGKVLIDRDLELHLAKRKKELEAKLKEEKDRAANMGALSSGLASVGAAVGTVVGTAYGGPIGGAAGGAAGGMAGSYLGTEISKSTQK